MENCKNCKYSFSRDLCTFCEKAYGEEILFPRFKGGSKKCECYIRKTNNKHKFVYPTKETCSRVIGEISDENSIKISDCC